MFTIPYHDNNWNSIAASQRHTSHPLTATSIYVATILNLGDQCVRPCIYISTLSVMVMFIGNRIGDPSSNPWLGSFISLHANALNKGMDSLVLHPVMGKQ